MRQAWHIFEKDSRQFRYPIALLLGWTALFAFSGVAWFENYAGLGDVTTWLYMKGLVWNLSPYALAGAWWVIIGLVVHNEPLAGDRQFWVTRPYSRVSLITAKALFIAAYFLLPLLAAQAVLLTRAGMPAGAWLTGLLWNQVLVAAVLVLPAFALAAVTSSFVQFVAASGAMAFAAALAQSGIPHGINWVRVSIVLGVSILTTATILRLQFAYRRTSLSRLIALTGTLLMLLSFVVLPWRAAFAVQASVRPLREGTLVAELRRPTPDPTKVPETLAAPSATAQTIQVSFTIGALPDSSSVVCDGISLSVDLTDGGRWNSDLWRNTGYWQAGADCAALFRVPSTVMSAAEPVHLSADLYVTVLRNHTPVLLTRDAAPITVGDVTCAARGVRAFSRSGRPGQKQDETQFTAAECRAAFASTRQVDLGSAGTAGPMPTSYSPYPGELAIQPIFARQILADAGEVAVIRRSPVAHVRLPVDAAGIRLSDFIVR